MEVEALSVMREFLSLFARCFFDRFRNRTLRFKLLLGFQIEFGFSDSRA